MSNTTENAKVLYIDVKGHPAPLSRCFHATASRHLSSSSSVERNPPTTKTQVDSAYCPQCLSVHDVTSAIYSLKGTCQTCQQCPLCMAVASVTTTTTTVIIDDDDAGTAFYKCGYCDWNSQSCGITTTITPGTEGTIGKEEMLKASQDLVDLLKAKTKDADAAAKSRYQDLLSAWEVQVKPKQPAKRKPSLQAWSLEALEESLVSKHQHDQDDEEKQEICITSSSKVVMMEESDKPLLLDSSLQDTSCESLLLQSTISSTLLTNTSKDSLLPLPMPLKCRKSRRDLREIQNGKPGILVKPKLNPLDGDSSLKIRGGHGQWWKKDSSAHFVIPKLAVVLEKHSSQQESFLLKVTNPTMSSVKLQLGPSKYTGERDDSNVMKHVLMDSLQENYQTIQVLDGNVLLLEETTTTPSLVELEAVQDSLFMERRPKLPTEVVEWSGGCDATTTTVSIRHVATQKDAAWFELNVGAASVAEQQQQQQQEQDSSTWLAMPIALQIQVGNGSWESSLVKPREGEGSDFVSFDVLVAWDPNTS